MQYWIFHLLFSFEMWKITRMKAGELDCILHRHNLDAVAVFGYKRIIFSFILYIFLISMLYYCSAFSSSNFIHFYKFNNISFVVLLLFSRSFLCLEGWNLLKDQKLTKLTPVCACGVLEGCTRGWCWFPCPSCKPRVQIPASFVS